MVSIFLHWRQRSRKTSDRASEKLNNQQTVQFHCDISFAGLSLSNDCCGIDLHANAMSLYVLDATAETLLHKKIPTKPVSFLRLIEPCREEPVVGCEGMFTWSWLLARARNELRPPKSGWITML